MNIVHTWPNPLNMVDHVSEIQSSAAAAGSL